MEFRRRPSARDPHTNNDRPSRPGERSWLAADLARAAGVPVSQLPGLLSIVSRASGAVFEWSPDRRTVRAWGLEPLMGLAPTPIPKWYRAKGSTENVTDGCVHAERNTDTVSTKPAEKPTSNSWGSFRDTIFFLVATAAITLAIMATVGTVPCTNAGTRNVSHVSDHR